MAEIVCKKPEFISRQVTDARYFFLDLDLDLDTAPTSSLTVVGGGCEHCLPGYRVQRAEFPYLGIEYVLRGKGWYRAGGRVYELGEGSVFTYGPGLAHQIWTERDDPLVKYFIDFTGNRGLELLSEAALMPGHAVRIFIPQRIMGICEMMLQDGARATPYSPRLCSTLLEHLVLKTAENALAEGSGHLGARSTYLRCRFYIEEHYLQLRNLEDIVRGCQVNRAYLCRLFQRFDNQSPYQLLTRLKMNRAAELLMTCGLLVKQVADKLGYVDTYHFSRTFKRVYGVSPEQFLQFGERDLTAHGCLTLPP